MKPYDKQRQFSHESPTVELLLYETFALANAEIESNKLDISRDRKRWGT